MMRKVTWKVAALIALLVICLFVFAGCEVKTGNRITSGRDVQTFNYAWIKLGDETVVKGAVTQWRDYDNSDTVQVLIGGKFYLTHYTNAVLIADPEAGPLTYSDSDWFGVDE